MVTRADSETGGAMIHSFYPPSKPLYRIKAICPWDPRLHGPWSDARSGVWEQDEKKIPGQPVTP